MSGQPHFELDASMKLFTELTALGLGMLRLLQWFVVILIGITVTFTSVTTDTRTCHRPARVIDNQEKGRVGRDSDPQMNLPAIKGKR